MLKICSKCLESKPTNEFFVKDQAKGRLHAQCKSCYKTHRQGYYAEHYKIYRKEYLHRAQIRREKARQEFRTNMLQYLVDKYCTDCEENDIRVLEFDHIDPVQKSFSVSQAVKFGKKWSEVLAEIEKCQILCANCHKKRTAVQFGWYKN